MVSVIRRIFENVYMNSDSCPYVFAGFSRDGSVLLWNISEGYFLPIPMEGVSHRPKKGFQSGHLPPDKAPILDSKKRTKRSR